MLYKLRVEERLNFTDQNCSIYYLDWKVLEFGMKMMGHNFLEIEIELG